MKDEQAKAMTTKLVDKCAAILFVRGFQYWQLMEDPIECKEAIEFLSTEFGIKVSEDDIDFIIERMEMYEDE